MPPPLTGPGRLAAVVRPWPDDGAPARAATAVDAAGYDAPTVPSAVPGVPRRRLAGLADRWVPAAWRTARLDPGRPAAVALLLTATVAAVIAAVGVWREAPRAEPVADLPALVDTRASTALAASAGPTPTPAPAPLVVAVAGRVARPGLVRVPAGSRVADVIEAAGGPLPHTDLAGVNLARKVSDGEQVAVGVPGATDAVPAGAPDAGDPAGGAASGPLDLNSATVGQLDGLPGVGPVTAQHIVDWRTRNGRFASVDQLREVDGIGERRFGQLRDLVRV